LKLKAKIDRTLKISPIRAKMSPIMKIKKGILRLFRERFSNIFSLLFLTCYG
jgi:hypothetical protein